MMLRARILLLAPALACTAPAPPAPNAPAAPTAPAPVRAVDSVICIANEAGRPVPAIASDTREACDAFAGRQLSARFVTSRVAPGAAAAPVSSAWPELTSAWAPPSHAPGARILYYEGHGYSFASCGAGTQALCLVSPLGEHRFPWHELAELIPGPGDREGWGVLLLNTCDSGFADVRPVPAPFSLVSAGLGLVPAGRAAPLAALSGPQLGWFSHLLARALADPTTDTNCDGMMTDREFQETMNVSLKQRPVSKLTNPIVTVKRQADADLPLVWVSAPSNGCADQPALEALLAAADARTLPEGFRRDLELHGVFLRDRGPVPVESALRYLWLEDSRACPAAGGKDATRTLIETRAALLGFLSVPAPASPPASPHFAGQLARAATFTRVERLTLSPGGVKLDAPDGQKLLRLDAGAAACVPPDLSETNLATDPGHAALRVLRCLPSRLTLVTAKAGLEDLGCDEVPPDPTLGDICPITGTSQACIAVRVDGRFPTTPVRLVRWQDFMARGGAATGVVLDWTDATAIPCNTASGQCFKLKNPEGTPRRVADWLLLEARFSGSSGAQQ
jgi:hypothetical protein